MTDEFFGRLTGTGRQSNRENGDVTHCTRSFIATCNKVGLLKYKYKYQIVIL